MLAGKRSGLLTCIVTKESVSLCARMNCCRRFWKLESAIRAVSHWLLPGSPFGLDDQWPRAEAGASASTAAGPPKEKENIANTSTAGV